MSENKFLLDKGLFLGQSEFNFSFPVPFERILNDINKIRDYRNLIQDNTDVWDDYVQEFFHALGYQTIKKNPRLLTLTPSYDGDLPKALALVLTPQEDFRQIIQGMSWDTYLFYAANYYQVRWGILTNGCELKILDFQRTDYQDIFFSADLDDIISANQLDSFFTIYKIFHYINGQNEEVTTRKSKQKSKDRQKLVSSSYDLSFHTQNIPQSTVALFKALRQKIFTLSDSIAERYTKLYVGYSRQKTFCVVEIKKSKLSVFVNMTIDEIPDYSNYCEDVRQVGHHGVGDTKVVLQNPDDLDVVFEIIKQSYNKNS